MLKANAPLSTDRQKAFETLYHEQLLGAYETVSGGGSTLYYTRHVRKGLAHFLAGSEIHSMLDIGCGDFNWQSSLPLDDIEITAIDIIPELIAQNKRKWPNVRFEVNDIVKNIPAAHDLVLCRDLFTHFSHQETIAAINHIKQSGAKYLAATNYYLHQVKPVSKDYVQKHLNANHSAGYWRPVNLRQAPFFLPMPMLSITESQPGRTLDVWRLEDVPLLNQAYFDMIKKGGPVSPQDFAQLEFFQNLCALPFIEKIGLFGSRGAHTHHPDSDIDLIIFCKAGITPRQWAMVCNIADAPNIPFAVECARYQEGMQGDLFNEYVTLYERVG